ncbi:Hypothetical predicted protein [Olea europaea subsp. europaea]|uniref:Uncharacterized protein n=1 Tax=Olea europaea subsp. europaea TaxID=158383 RepID=A0A8S0QE06_OLEEU|nr:Hypothetical predicted protein [Olea europaea subsp. europaea]
MGGRKALGDLMNPVKPSLQAVPNKGQKLNLDKKKLPTPSIPFSGRIFCTILVSNLSTNKGQKLNPDKKKLSTPSIPLSSRIFCTILLSNFWSSNQYFGTLISTFD